MSYASNHASTSALPRSRANSGSGPLNYERPLSYPVATRRPPYPERQMPVAHHYPEAVLSERMGYSPKSVSPTSSYGHTRNGSSGPVPVVWDRPPPQQGLLARPMLQPTVIARNTVINTHNRRTSASAASTRMFEPSESWKQSNTSERRPRTFTANEAHTQVAQRRRPTLLQSKPPPPPPASSRQARSTWKSNQEDEERYRRPADNGWGASNDFRRSRRYSTSSRGRSNTPPSNRGRSSKSRSFSRSRSRSSSSTQSSRSPSPRQGREQQTPNSRRTRSSSSPRSPSVDSLASSRASPIPGVIPVSPVLARSKRAWTPELADAVVEAAVNRMRSSTPPAITDDIQDAHATSTEQSALETSPTVAMKDQPTTKIESPSEEDSKAPLAETVQAAHSQVPTTEDAKAGVPTQASSSPMARSRKHAKSADAEQTRSQISLSMDMDLTLDDVPPISSADTLREAVRLTAMTRHVLRSSEQQERISSVLAANRALAKEEAHLDLEMYTNADDLVAEFSKGARLEARERSFVDIRQSLVDRLENWERGVSEKANRLRAEYLSLHKKWEAQCAKLDHANRPESEVDASVVSAPSGRTTRRTAGLGDMVRSDLEMEQIIASLGVDDAFDPAQLSAQNLAVIPDMISVQRGAIGHIYDDSNLRVEDASAYYAPDTGIDDWDAEEEKIFLHKYAQYPKQFGLIATFLPHKNAAACVTYYYLRKKEIIDFRKAISKYGPGKRRRRKANGSSKRKTNALLSDIIDHDAEVIRDTEGLVISGAGSSRATKAKVPVAGSESRRITRRLQQQNVEATPTASPTPEPPVTRLKRARASTTTALSVSVATRSSTPTTVDEVQVEEQVLDVQPKRKKARRSRVKSQAFVEEEDAEPEPPSQPSSLPSNPTLSLESTSPSATATPTPKSPVPAAVLSANLHTLMQSQSLFTATVNGYTPYGAAPSYELPTLPYRPPLPSRRRSSAKAAR